jgi:hypothetical protein
MDVDAQMWGEKVNLATLQVDDRELILSICKTLDIDIMLFGNYLDAAIINNSEWPLKMQIRDAQTQVNKERQKQREELKINRKRVPQKKYSFEQITSKLEKYQARGGKMQQCEIDFAKRTNANLLVKGWNVDTIPQESLDGRKAHLELVNLLEIKPYDHWNLTAGKRVESLNSQFDQFVDKIKRDMNITTFSDLGTTSSDIVTVVGRLVNTDSDVAFNTNIELVNISEENENGLSKIKLNFSEGLEYCIFEGQIVVLEGTSDHDTFTVTSIKALSVPKIISEESMSMDEGFVSVMIFTGPYTFAENMNYSVLKHICSLINDQQPQLVILGGPFLDINHVQVSEGELFYHDDNEKVNWFEDRIIYGAIKEYLKQETQTSGTKIVMIPSLNDIFSQHPFPQPPLSENSEEKICFLSNPSQFSVNGVEFGVVNTDIIRKIMSKAQNTNKTRHRLNVIMDAFVQQRSYFPLYPADAETSIDISQYEKYQMPRIPDVLITMSELPVFTDIIDDKIIYLNPGQVVKTSKAGTYAVVTINTENSAKTLKDKVSVEIKNL